ncbi:MAG TPA: MaoC/PaaZ C-terminal domain-containing protein [Roseiarcus sp.]|nr:MaoC/PaaZ C-terminal domain-containing protein [Roseiarcus sp.]
MSSPTATSCISVSPTSAMTGGRFFEDFPAGEVVEYGGLDVTAEAIVAFAREVDPQPFHVDAEAAIAATGGLIASGWHTAALLLKMNCEAFLIRTEVVDEKGVEEVRWALPVRPGDQLQVRRRTLSAQPSGASESAGDVEFLFEVVNQDGAVVMTQRSVLSLMRRQAAD